MPFALLSSGYFEYCWLWVMMEGREQIWIMTSGFQDCFGFSFDLLYVRKISNRFFLCVRVHATESIYRIEHLRLFFTGMMGQSTARIASSNTVLRPFWVRAEHSKYLTAPISLAIASPWG